MDCGISGWMFWLAGSRTRTGLRFTACYLTGDSSERGRRKYIGITIKRRTHRRFLCETVERAILFPCHPQLQLLSLQKGGHSDTSMSALPFPSLTIHCVSWRRQVLTYVSANLGMRSFGLSLYLRIRFCQDAALHPLLIFSPSCALMS